MPSDTRGDVKARSALRATFTKKWNSLEELIIQEDRNLEEIKGLLVLITQKRDELQRLNALVQQGLIDDEADDSNVMLEAEIDTCDSYELKFNTIRARCEVILKEKLSEGISQATLTSSPSQEHRRQFKLPLLELKKFEGEVRDWLPFWSQFEKIDQDNSIDKADKFQYLIQATIAGSRARELVESFPATSNNYEKAIMCLKNRFGREDLLVEVYVRDLLGLVLKNTTSSKKGALVSLYDKLECKLRALETLEVTTDKCASMLMPLVESCLPEDTLRAWQRSPLYIVDEFYQEDNSRNENVGAPRTDIPKHRLNQLMKFLRTEIENEQKIKLALAGFDMKVDDRKKERNSRDAVNIYTKNVTTAAGLVTTTKGNTCVFCDGKHYSSQCTVAKEMTTMERKNILDKRVSCYCCLLRGHRASTCRSKYRCTACGRKHSVLICEKFEQNNRKDGLPRKPNNLQDYQDNVIANIDNSGQIILQTFLVKLVGRNSERIARAIIDTGSQRSYILKEAAVDMNYEPVRQERIKHELFAGLNTGVVEHDVYKIQLSDLQGTYRCQFEMLDQSTICGKIDPLVPGKWLQALKQYNIELNDFEDKAIEILFGADTISKLITGKQYEILQDLLAVETRLGWTLIGRVPENYKKSLGMIAITSTVKVTDITDLWSLDVLGIMDPIARKKKDELQLQAQEYFLRTVTVNDDGRYVVRLPWVENHPPLPNNYALALKRLDVTVKRLKTSGYYNEYGAVFKEWIKEGIIEEIPADDLKETVHYLPHRHVIKLNSTTKIRPVFDASAKMRNCPSLNGCLEKGPNLIEMIPSILTRFRLGKIGVISDIRKAFLQISIFKQDRDFLRFLWYDEKNNLRVYRHKRVVFGVSCSPFLLGAVIQYHLKGMMRKCEDGEKEFSLDVLKKMCSSFYVDNCVACLDKEEELNSFVAEASAIMNEACFDLRGWEYTVLKTKTENNTCPPSNVLGMSWNREADTLSVNLDSFKFDLTEITKRSMLSAAHKIFDPIGVTCPVLLLPKLLLQKVWLQKLGWDQCIAENDAEQFIRWQQELTYLRQLNIPRWLKGVDDPIECTIHVFNDASQHAYATAIFLRLQTYVETKVQLIQAKSRISPRNKVNKRMTIPRLELLAANMGTRLYQTVIKDLNLAVSETFFWSDSTTVLAWIEREEEWDVFVRNRVKEIKELSTKQQWHYVPGSYNPADLPSRGCSARKLLESQWWNGPSWLRQSDHGWSNHEISYNEEEINQEKKKKIISSTVLLCRDENIEWYYRYFSKYRQIVRMVGWLMRFKGNCCKNKDIRQQGELLAEEFIEAELRLLRLVQKHSFKGISDPKLANLQPCVGTDGLIRMKTKISYGDYDEDFCFPIVLPDHHHPVVERLIREQHTDSNHAGCQLLTARLRKRFWILGGRRAVRSVLNRCIVCKRHSTKRIQVPAPPLPIDRVRDAKIFEIVGIDLAGPLYIKTKEKSEYKKVWICLYTCAVYRAVHLELISSLSTERFITCLRKFISRRGRPSVIYTDNGTNFVGTENALSGLNWNEIKMYSSVKRIRWKFNPPTAAWWGGWWERLIGLVKQLLRRILGRTSLDFDKMQATLYECEAVINSRPLTYLSEDPADLTPLTPDLFLKEITDIDVADLDAIEKTTDLNRRARYRQELKRVLKERFQDEYLGCLRLYAKKNSTKNIGVGDLVLIENEKVKRIEWPLARVEEIIPGREGVTRLVKLKTSTGSLFRPIQRIFPLEMDGSQQTKPRARDITHRPVEKNTVELEVPIRTRRGRVVKPPSRLVL